MNRFTRGWILALPLVAILPAAASSAPTPKDNPKPKAEGGVEFIRKVLDAKVTMEFSGIGLGSVLAQVGEDHRINLVLDEATIRMMGFEPGDIMINCKLKDVKLRAGLRTMLNQYNLTVAIVGDTVLVTTEEQAIYRQLKQRISVDVENLSISKALKDLTQSTGVNIVVDPRTTKNKANEAPVSLSVDDVPLEAAVRLMCEMAGLKPVRMGNVIFITTEDRAEKLKDSDSLVPSPGIPGLPGGVNPGFPGGIVPGFGGGGAMPVPAAPVAPPVEEKSVPDKIEKDPK